MFLRKISCCRRVKRGRQSGYTLIELLLAVGIIGMVGALLAGHFASSTAAYRKTAETIQRAGQEQMTVYVIERDLGMTGYTSWSGYPDSLIFYILDSSERNVDATGYGRYVRVSYALSSEGDGRFCRMEQKYGAETIDTTVLCRNIDSVIFSYAEFGPSNQLIWNEEWTSHDSASVPIAVNMDLVAKVSREADNPIRFSYLSYLPLGGGNRDISAEKR